VRKPGTSDGLTKAQAEAALRKLMTETTAPPVTERVTVEDAAQAHLSHLEAMGRKPSTLRSYRVHLRTQILPRLGSKVVGRVRREDVEAFVSDCVRSGLAPKPGSTKAPDNRHERREWKSPTSKI
jgi:hypothetical protein